MIAELSYNEQLFFAILSLFIIAGYGWLAWKS
jgi:hypothetical protein